MEKNPTGANLYINLVTCVYCEACYTACGGADIGCIEPPASSCDTATTSAANCGNESSGCVGCAFNGTCSSELSACQNSVACFNFIDQINTCPD